MINYFVEYNGEHCFEIRHFYTPSYFKTMLELETAYKPMIDWIQKNIRGWVLIPMDNAAFSDYNEDPWVGYYLNMKHKEDAIMFKTRWVGV